MKLIKNIKSQLIICTILLTVIATFIGCNNKKSDSEKKSQDATLPKYELNVTLSKNQWPTDSGEYITSTEAYSINAKQWSFINLFGLQLKDKHRSRVLSNKPDFNVDLDYFCDTTYHKKPKEILIKKLQEKYSYSYKEEIQETNCWILKISDKNILDKTISISKESSWASNDSLIVFKAQSLEQVAKVFEAKIGEVVLVDKTDKENLYDLEFNKNTIARLKLHDGPEYKLPFGLKLIRSTRPVEILTLTFN